MLFRSAPGLGVDELLVEGADPEARSRSVPITPMDYWNNWQRRKYGYTLFLGYTPLMLAAMGGRNDIAASLLKHGANPNATTDTDGGGDSVLNRAILYRHAETVRLLLQRGAKLNALDRAIADSNGTAEVKRMVANHLKGSPARSK